MEELNINTERALYFCGDIHGEIREFIWKALDRYKISNADIVILGDFGAGFDKSLPHEYARLEHRLIDKDVTIWVLRGNHDCPDYFISEEAYSFPRLKFMEDHKVYNLCGRTIYTVGGANSTDIVWRLGENEKLQNKKKDRKVWWSGEDIIRKYDGLPERVDIIISHSCPICFMPVLSRFDETPVEQYNKIREEREYLQFILQELPADYWYYGHYHSSFCGTYGELMYRGLNIMEFIEAAPIINKNPQGNDDGRNIEKSNASGEDGPISGNKENTTGSGK